MDEDHKERIILEFLRNHTLAVIATCHRNGTPEAATVDFSVRDNLEIVFDTFKHTRKFNNLAERPGVAFVVGWDDNITVQYEGEATRVPAAESDSTRKPISTAFRPKGSSSREERWYSKQRRDGFDIPISTKSLPS